MEQVRGLRFTRPVGVQPLPESELADRVTRSLDRSFPSGLYRRRSLAWRTIGAIPPGTKIRDEIDAFASQGGFIGFYNPISGNLVFIGSDQPTAVQRLTLAHELTHAVDDQHFTLSRLDPIQASCSDDRFEAALAAVEGSAQFFSFGVARRFFSAQDLASLQGGGGAAPVGVDPFVEQLELWPYAAGLQFISARQASGGNGAVNRAIGRFPTSTEQILHPDRYPSDAPVPVNVPDLGPALGARWHDLDVMPVGEAWLEILLGLRLDQGDAAAATDRWGGGIYRAWSDGRRAAVVLRTVWDSQEQARLFAAALGRWVDAPNETATIEIHRATVTASFASDPATLARLENALGTSSA